MLNERDRLDYRREAEEEERRRAKKNEEERRRKKKEEEREVERILFHVFASQAIARLRFC